VNRRDFFKTCGKWIGAAAYVAVLPIPKVESKPLIVDEVTNEDFYQAIHKSSSGVSEMLDMGERLDRLYMEEFLKNVR